MSEEKPVTPEAPENVAAPASAQPAPPVPPVHSATNGLAIASMVVGIVAFISGWIPFWGLLAGIAAVVLGILALKKPTAKGLSITGIVTGGLGALTSLLFSVIFIVALASSAALVGKAQEQSDKQSSQSQQQIDAKKDFAKGETATFGIWEVKVNSVTAGYVPTSSYYKAEDGNEYVVVNVTITNTGDDSDYISPYSFSINEDGLATETAFLSVDPELKSGSLDPGESTTGNLVFEVTKGATGLKLQYDATVYTNYETKNLTYTLAI
ncbi:MAG: DUF4190 domain-containing protein [Candidatus Microsaccharimonas sp.]